MANMPHILLLIDDEHRPDFMPIEGNLHIRTPTLDRLIERGTYFRNAYTPSPICVPARQSFLTGLYPHRNGCTGFDTPLPSDVITMPGYFSQYGYDTSVAGKMHFVGPDQMHGWNERIGHDIRGPNGYPAVEGAEFKSRGSREQGTGKWPTAKEITNARGGPGFRMRHDAYSVDGALIVIEDHFTDGLYDRPSDQPLLLTVSLTCPHYPYQCPEDLFNYYLNRVEPFVEDLPENFDCADFFKVEIRKDVTHREAHRATAAYYGMIDWVDMQYGSMAEL